MHPAELILKGKFFPSLKRWREVVDNNRGFKGKSEILIKDYHVYNVFLHSDLFYIHGYNCIQGENIILTSFWL
ncbi:hypothetical protein BKC07_15765 [Peribacillus simplex]|nr:hypothetical protein BKC07_15765 [Peribacillus simplex]